jgi:hypothetical protein
MTVYIPALLLTIAAIRHFKLTSNKVQIINQIKYTVLQINMNVMINGGRVHMIKANASY